MTSLSFPWYGMQHVILTRGSLPSAQQKRFHNYLTVACGYIFHMLWACTVSWVQKCHSMILFKYGMNILVSIKCSATGYFCGAACFFVLMADGISSTATSWVIFYQAKHCQLTKLIVCIVQRFFWYSKVLVAMFINAVCQQKTISAAATRFNGWRCKCSVLPESSFGSESWACASI